MTAQWMTASTGAVVRARDRSASDRMDPSIMVRRPGSPANSRAARSGSGMRSSPTTSRPAFSKCSTTFKATNPAAPVTSIAMGRLHPRTVDRASMAVYSDVVT